MDKEKAKLMYNDRELLLLKSTFAENEELLKAVRKLMFGAKVSLKEKESIESAFSDPDVIAAVKHKVYGLNNLETPIGQLSDFWMGAETQIFGASRDTIYQAVAVKEKVLKMFETAFALLTNPEGEKISLKVESILDKPRSEIDELQIDLIARNLFMKAIDGGLFNIMTIAGKKEETLEDVLSRLSKNSNK